MTTRRIAPYLLAVPALLFGALWLHAGPLSPPAGPVAGTYKTLSEVEPRIAINATNTPGDATSLFKITQPGSYYLTGNITGVAGKHGIAITASGVTLDLNGFDLTGVSGMGAFDGVSVVSSGLKNISILNGSVVGWGGSGINLQIYTVFNARIDRVLAFNNGVNGISVGHACTVSDCVTLQNTATGIWTGAACIVTNSTASSNTGNGFATGYACTVTGCSAYVNVGSGISAANGCTVTNCSASQNTGSGISTLDGCTISGCALNENTAREISANNGCAVSGCMTRNNQSDGIAVNYSCTVSGNTCNGDGISAGSQGGIHILGQANRVESNNVSYADIGVLADAGGNVIIRNTAKGCTSNWSIAAGNVCLVVQGVAGAAISGNTGGVAPGSTDPNANFTY